MPIEHGCATVDAMTHSHSRSHGHDHDHDHLASALDLDAELLGSYIDDAATVITRHLGRAPQRIVDLGAGTGTGTEALARRFGATHLIAVDSSAEMITRVGERARAGGFESRTTTVVADLDDGLPPLHSPDVIWAALSLHHVADPAALLREAASALAPGGVVAIVEMDGLPRFAPDADSALGTLEDRCHQAAAGAGWEALADWTETLGEAGFDVVHRDTIRIARTGPNETIARYAVHWFSQFRHRLADVLSDSDVALLDSLIDPDDPASLHRRADLTLTAGRRLWIARPATDHDVAVVGGGAAGLSAATTLARSLRSVVVIDGGEPRNAPAEGAHNVLGQEGISPLELLSRGRDEVRGYGGEVRSDTVVDARPDGDRFILSLASGGTVRARRLLLATGLVDELPEIPGVAELWGRDALHCPYCHGYEARGSRVVVLATSPMSAHQALLFTQLSDDVTLVAQAPDAIGDEDRTNLAAAGVSIIDDTVKRLRTRDDAGTARLDGVELSDGTVLKADAVVVAPRFAVRGDLYERLGGTLSQTPMGEVIETGPMGATAIPGVWAAGNNTTLNAVVTVAMGEGVSAGAAINADLVMADVLRGKAVEHGR